MFPLFPFVAGVLTGAVALRLLKTDKSKAGLEKAQDKLRDATVSSLEAIENASARARKRLATPEAAEKVAAPAEEVSKPPKPAARKRAPRAAKAAPSVATKAAPKAGEEAGES